MLYSVLFRFGHIRRSDQCAVYILYSKISTDPGLPLKIRHSHRFVELVIQFLIPLVVQLLTTGPGTRIQTAEPTTRYFLIWGLTFAYEDYALVLLIPRDTITTQQHCVLENQRTLPSAKGKPVDKIFFTSSFYFWYV